ncbi:hypothetical protein PVL30_002489 [Lodderomyces elongisporus]|nr:hypothetical protein PVL30_002483 [Lodderomyces elongisporus]WLF78742.1 hypothetical protein PVL30_002484 [Lodderomyces elongisporus]WLF78743.1 hypothetical protein PVL30_002485 [Lodderomyces elongisporus]WLF78744.1 hypothetical protein PVL30_002486 [Lodderomyces elongisporus]WLF78745.1 hypothetical protein PVL30_002487 [Lodderomyces elongisporus]
MGEELFEKPSAILNNFSLVLLGLFEDLSVILCSYSVDPASSHMLVSKIKPCMSKYKQLYSETANGSLNQLSFI